MRKGETGTTVVFTKKLTFKDKESEEEKRVNMLRTYTVFNVEQIEGFPEVGGNSADLQLDLLENNPIQRFIDATRADIRTGGDRACYVPSHDFVALPPAEAFKSQAHYHATGLHELSHWTGNKKRLDRDLTGRFKTKAYAAEELVFVT